MAQPIQLSQEQLRKYIAYDGEFCPICGSHEINEGEIDSWGVKSKYCFDCQTSWDEIYAMTGIVVFDKEDVETTYEFFLDKYL